MSLLRESGRPQPSPLGDLRKEQLAKVTVHTQSRTSLRRVPRASSPRHPSLPSSHGSHVQERPSGHHIDSVIPEVSGGTHPEGTTEVAVSLTLFVGIQWITTPTRVEALPLVFWCFLAGGGVGEGQNSVINRVDKTEPILIDGLLSFRDNTSYPISAGLGTYPFLTLFLWGNKSKLLEVVISGMYLVLSWGCAIFYWARK